MRKQDSLSEYQRGDENNNTNESFADSKTNDSLRRTKTPSMTL